MSQFGLLDQAAEDKLHSTRLLNIEERPFKRITKRLLAPTTPIASYLTRTPKNATDPPSPSPQDGTNNDNEQNDTTTSPPPQPSSTQTTTLPPTDQTKYLHDLQRFRSDTILDFSAFDSSIARTQFLYLANQKQRRAYADEKIQIQSTSSTVRSDTERLKVRLEEAQKTLSVRKGYDVLAEKITRNKDLKSRDEQAVNIERLRNEIEELEREGVELGNAWEERREQFGKVVEEGGRLRRVVRGEPEPDAKGEDEEQDSDGDDDGDEGGRRADGEGDGDGDGDGENDRERDENMLGLDEHRDHDGISHAGTPRPMGDGDGDGDIEEEGASTPLPLPLSSIHENDNSGTPRSTPADPETSSTPRPDEKSLGGGDADMKEDVPAIKIDEMDMT